MSNIEDSDAHDQTLKLPNELLHQILSFLPYSSITTTKFLCKRLYNLWTTVSQSSGTINGLDRAIQTFLDGINASDPFQHPWKLSYSYENESLLRACVTSNWCLHMNFFRPEKTNGLFHLSLESPARNDAESDHETTSFHVKRLTLASVSSHFTSNVISSVVSRFGFLRFLRIQGCRMNTLHVSIPELRELVILDCFLLKSVHVIAPKLVVFRFKGSRPWFLAKGLVCTKLVDAMLDFRSGVHSKYLGGKLNVLLSLLIVVESMTICRATLEEVITSEQYKNCEKIKFEKLKELWWIDNSVDKQRTELLLNFLSICPGLERLFITIDPKSSWSRSMVKRFDRPVKCNSFSRLELVKIEGCVDEDAESLLAEAITNSATMNPLIVSRTNDGIYRKYVRIESESIKTKHAFMDVIAKEEKMMSELKHAHMNLDGP